MSAQQQKIPAFDVNLRRIGLAGQLTLTTTVIGFLFLGARWPEPYADLWKLVTAHIVAGRAGNVALGLELEFPSLFLFAQCFLQDIIVLMLFYPLVIAGYRRAVEWKLLGSALEKVRETADKHKSRLEPFGALGLMLFVVFPFWSTGALVGAVVGYLIGMRTWVAFASVTVGNIIAVALWVWFFERLKGFTDRLAAEFHFTDKILIIVVFALVAFALISQVWRSLRTRKAVQDPPDETAKNSDGKTAD